MSSDDNKEGNFVLDATLLSPSGKPLVKIFTTADPKFWEYVKDILDKHPGTLLRLKGIPVAFSSFIVEGSPNMYVAFFLEEDGSIGTGIPLCWVHNNPRAAVLGLLQECVDHAPEDGPDQAI